MSKAVSAAFAGLLTLLLAACGRPSELVELPAGSARLGSHEPGAPAPHDVAFAGGRIGRTELTCGEFVRFLNATNTVNPGTHQQFKREGERWRAVDPEEPVASVSRADAEAYCSWRSLELGAKVRLPTEDEWEFAARGGGRGATYPWGWNSPSNRAVWNATAAARVATFAPNGHGLHDLAGNLAEWCAAGDPASTSGVVRGGNWADRDPARLRVFSRVDVPAGYRDRDVGFRIFVEPPCR